MTKSIEINMTKSVDINVTREDARTTIVEILKECEKIRREYVHALNDFYAPLESVEEEYRRQIHRLAAVSKEDPDLTRELGRLEVMAEDKMFAKKFAEKDQKTLSSMNQKTKLMQQLSSGNELFIVYCFLNTLQSSSSTELIPRISKEGNANALIDGVIHFSKRQVPAWSACYISEKKKMACLSKKRSLATIYSGNNTNWLNAQYSDYGPDGFYLLIPDEIKKGPAAVFIKTVKNAFFKGDDDTPCEGILYKLKQRFNTPVIVPRAKPNFSYELGAVYKQVASSQQIDAFVEECLCLGRPANFFKYSGFLFGLTGKKEKQKYDSLVAHSTKSLPSHELGEAYIRVASQKQIDTLVKKCLDNPQHLLRNIDFLFGLTGKDEIPVEYQGRKLYIGRNSRG